MADKLDGLIISEILADNAGGAAVDVDGDGRTNKADEFIEIQSTNGAATSLAGYELWSQKEGLLYAFGGSSSIGAGQTATVVGNYDGTPPAGYYSAGVAENANWLPDGEGQKFDSIFLVNSISGDYVVLSYGNPPRTPVLPAGFPGTTRIGAGETIDSNAPNGTAFSRDASGDFSESSPTPDSPGVTCFKAGTLIETQDGCVPVCALVPGTMILTRDSAPQRLLARRETFVSARSVEADPTRAPIHIPRGMLGATRALEVSPSHCILWRDPRAELMFGAREMLMPAHHLLGYGARRARVSKAGVTYHHLLFAQHELVSAHGVWSESLFMGEVACAARRDLAVWQIAPDVALRDVAHVSTARPVLHGFEARALLGNAGSLAA